MWLDSFKKKLNGGRGTKSIKDFNLFIVGLKKIFAIKEVLLGLILGQILFIVNI